MASTPILAFDVGGSFVKAGLVDPAAAAVQGEVLKWPTPASAAPEDVIAMLANKDAAGFLHILAPMLNSVTAVPIPGHDCHSPEDLCDMARAAGSGGCEVARRPGGGKRKPASAVL